MLGLKIKAYMDARGIKQTFLADKTGMGLTTINAILNGNRKIEANEYYDICKALDKPLDFSFRKKNKHTFDKKNIPLLRMCVNGERRREGMKSIDKVINSICDWIQGELKQTGSTEDSMILPEMIKALAELVSASSQDY